MKTKTYFTKNKFFTYSSVHNSMVKVCNSGYTTDLIDILSTFCYYDDNDVSAFTKALGRIKEFRRLMVEGPIDSDFTISMDRYRYKSPDVKVYATLKPKVLDCSIVTTYLTATMDSDFNYSKVFDQARDDLLVLWESTKSKTNITQEYIDDIDEVIEALTYATLNGGFECKEEI